MKQLTCEMCGSSDLIKQDGVFECQSCGCKYSVEEARKMMVEGTVDVSGSTVKVDNSGMIESYLNMAINAVDAGNNQEAESYANKVIELDTTNSIAWMVKGAAAGWQTTGVNNRFNEAIDCWINAIENINDENALRVLGYIYDTVNHLANAIVQLHCNHFVDYRSEDNAEDIKNSVMNASKNIATLAGKVLIGTYSLDVIERKSDAITNGNDELAEKLNEIIEKALDFGDLHGTVMQEISLKVNASAVSAYKEANNDFGPEKSDKTDYAYDRWLDEITYIVEIEELAMGISNDPSTIEQIYKNIKFIQEDKIESCSYEYSASAYSSSYVKSKCLTDASKKNIRNKIIIAEGRKNSLIKEINERVEKERKEKVEEFWEEHKFEKQALEDERDSLKQKINEIEASFTQSINSIITEKNNVQGAADIEQMQSTIKQLKSERDSLGFFKGKEKAALQEKIDTLESKIKAIEERMKAEYDDIQSRLDEENERKKAQTSSYQTRLERIEYLLDNGMLDTEANKSIESDDIETDDEVYEVECPSCGETVFLSKDEIESDDIICPFCGVELELEIDED